MATILNKPDLTYKKHYDTNGNVIDKNLNIDDNLTDNKIPGKDESIKDELDDIKNKLPIIPMDIIDTFIPPFLVVDEVIKDILDKVKELPDITSPLEPEVIYPEGPDIDLDIDPEDIPDDPFDKDDDIFINIPVVEENLEDKINKEYYNDLLDVLKDYLEKYNAVISKYLIAMMSLVGVSDNSTLNVITTKDLKNSNLSHSSDYLVKSKILLKQKLLLSKKLFDTNDTIFHIRAVKAAFEQRKRYSLNENLEDKGSLSKNSNNLLKESILVSEKKYKENFLSLYKYLNSSVILLNECVDIMIKQKENLVLLNNYEREN